MKIRIDRQSDRTFLVLDEYPFSDQDYALNMIRICPLDNLLACDTWFCDGQDHLRYTVTGLAPLSQRFADIPIQSADIRSILYSLRDICLRLPDYLLDPEDLLLDPDGIFVSPGDIHVSFCYVPGLQNQKPASRRLLAEFLLRHTDHKDGNAADLAYAFYDCATDENCVLVSALPSLLQKFTSGPLSASEHTAGSSYSASAVPDVKGSRSQTAAGPVRDLDDFSFFEEEWTSDSPYTDSPHADPPTPPSHTASPHPAIPKAVRRKQEENRRFLIILAVLLAAAGGCAAYLFHMDAAQIGGIGFLSAALVWLARQQQYKRSGDLQNIWSDEEQQMEDDDTFYRSLLNEVYAQPGESVKNSSTAPAPSHARTPSPTCAPSSAPEPSSVPAPVSSPSPGFSPSSGACLRSLEPDRYNDIPLGKSLILIGKNARECDICLKFDTVSRIHAKIEKIGDDFYLTDLFSTNGTFLDGRRLQPNHAAILPEGSEVAFARCRYRFTIIVTQRH